MALPALLVSVSFAVGTVVVVFVGFFAWFGEADLFAKRRRRRRTGLGLGFGFVLGLGLGALVLIRLVASSPRRAVVLVPRG